MSAHAGQAKLNDAMKKLTVQWRRVRSQWRDEAGRHFEIDHLEPMQVDVRKALEAMSTLVTTLDKARRECE